MKRNAILCGFSLFTLGLSYISVRESFSSVKQNDKIIFTDARIIPYANVIFDLDRHSSLSIVHGYLNELGITYCGRYGEWGYHWTDDSFISGKKAAQKVLDLI